MLPICDLLKGDKMLQDILEQILVSMLRTYNERCHTLEVGISDEMQEELQEGTDDEADDSYRPKISRRKPRTTFCLRMKVMTSCQDELLTSAPRPHQ